MELRNRKLQGYRISKRMTFKANFREGRCSKSVTLTSWKTLSWARLINHIEDHESMSTVMCFSIFSTQTFTLIEFEKCVPLLSTTINQLEFRLYSYQELQSRYESKSVFSGEVLGGRRYRCKWFLSIM